MSHGSWKERTSLLITVKKLKRNERQVGIIRVVISTASFYGIKFCKEHCFRQLQALYVFSLHRFMTRVLYPDAKPWVVSMFAELICGPLRVLDSLLCSGNTRTG
jgi:hypothetical protein